MTLILGLLNFAPLIFIVAGAIAFMCSIYKVAGADKALIITGGKEPIIKVSGGDFVIPIFRKAQLFDLCMKTVYAAEDELKTKTQVPILVDWTAQIRPYINDNELLKKAIISFMDRTDDEIVNDVRLTITGVVRATVAGMTPEEVQRDQATFKATVEKAATEELAGMGLELVSLNIQSVSDKKGYYDNIAAIDQEAKRLEAQKVKAKTDQQIREQQAESDRIAEERELAKDLAIAEKKRDNALKQAEFKAETDKANADAAIAGQLQETIRQQEVAEQEGRVAVVRQEQANLAAQKEQQVEKTKAETDKIKATIKAQESAEVNVINAESRARVAEQDATGKAKAAAAFAEGNAKAEEIEATGKAKAKEAEATGIAKAVTLQAEANANATKLEGEAKADVTLKQGTAEAEAIKAKLLAEAEGEKALADARASNDKVNFEIEKLKIEMEAKIQIATNTAKVMAEIGKNAEFVNIGGQATGQSGNVLVDTLSAIPGLMKTLNAENQALNGQTINEEIKGLVGAVAEPTKGLLVNVDKE